MEFSLDRIKTFPNAVSLLIDTMIQAGKHIYQQEAMASKPSWLVHSEKFSSFYERIKRNEEALDKMKHDVVRPVFGNYELEFNSKLINENSVVQDEFLKVELEESEDFTISAPKGLFFKAGKLYLPFSETYSQIVSYNKRNGVKNSPYPLMLLLGLYSSVFNAVKEQETPQTNECFKENIQILLDGLEGCDGIPKRRAPDNNPMNMLQNMMQNFDFGQLSEMMGKVTGDEKASQEFGEVFGKMTESIKEGKNPLESMGEIIKNVSARMEEEEDPDVPLVKEEVSEVSEKEEVSEVSGEVFSAPVEPVPETL